MCAQTRRASYTWYYIQRSLFFLFFLRLLLLDGTFFLPGTWYDTSAVSLSLWSIGAPFLIPKLLSVWKKRASISYWSF